MKHTSSFWGILGATAISTLTLPAFANTATAQTSTQSTTITGDNNQVIQVINQITVNHPGRGQVRTNNSQSGSTQDSYQGVVIEGSGNSVYQESTQINQAQQANRSGPRADQNNPSSSRRRNDDRHSRKADENHRGGREHIHPRNDD